MPVADFSLAGKVAIVTGGSRGIGRSIAVALAEAGADVCVAARKPEALEETLTAIKATGRRGIAVPTNVRDMDALQNLVNETKSQLGRIDVLVNNAGIFRAADFLDVTEEDFDAVLRVNLKGAFLVGQALSLIHISEPTRPY